MKFNLKKPSKKVILISSAVVLVLAIGCGVWYYLGHSSSEPVYVYPFQYVGMTEYWGDSQESYGPVSTDKIQTIFLSDTQTVTEVCVKEGDEVKKGDLLMTFDTTLSDLALERKRLAVEKLGLQMKEAQKQLREINSMKPMEVPELTPPEMEGPALGDPLEGDYKVYGNEQNNGSSGAAPLICWVDSTQTFDSAFLKELFAAILNEAQGVLPPEEPETPEETEPPTAEPTKPAPEPSVPAPSEAPPSQPGDEDNEGGNGDDTVQTPGDDESQIPGDDGIQNPGDDDETDREEGDDPPQVAVTPDPVAPEEPENPVPPAEEAAASNASGITFFEDTEEGAGTSGSCFVIIKATADNMSQGPMVTWQGIEILKGGLSFKFFNAAGIPDFTLNDDGGIVDMPDMDLGSGMTAAQIAQMRSDQQKKIKDLEYQIMMADAEYKIMKTEISDGNIYSDIDGKVISLLSEEEAKEQSLPVMKVSGGGGFYIDGTVNELDKDNLKIGQEVTINDWRGGGTYTGTIQEVGDFPSMEASWNGMGNPNASYYPFRVFVDETADLQADSYVSVMYAAGTSENGIYLQNPFLRTEKGRSYVMVKGENGRLEQRYVTVGKALWGSYTEILSGLTAEDLVAFPYGKTVKPGVAVQEGDMSNLYG